ncbi:PerC family transcriptional regulator, partial [Escherichia coli]
LDISEVAKAADATLRRMGIASPSGEVFRKFSWDLKNART